jgi:hypothetical protein
MPQVRFTRCPNDGLWVGRPLNESGRVSCPECGLSLQHASVARKFSLFGEQSRAASEAVFRLARFAHDISVLGEHEQVAYAPLLADAASEACEVVLTSNERPALALAPLVLDAARRVCARLDLPAALLDDENHRPPTATTRASRALDFRGSGPEAVDLGSAGSTARFSPSALFQAGLLSSAARALIERDGESSTAAAGLRAQIREHILSRLRSAEVSRCTVHFLLEASAWTRDEDQLFLQQLLASAPSEMHRAAVLSTPRRRRDRPA